MMRRLGRFMTVRVTASELLFCCCLRSSFSAVECWDRDGYMYTTLTITFYFLSLSDTLGSWIALRRYAFVFLLDQEFEHSIPDRETIIYQSWVSL